MPGVLKVHLHEVFDLLFLHQKNPLGPLIQTLNYFQYLNSNLVGVVPLILISHVLLLSAPFKGTHARDFYSLFLNFFLHLSVTNRYKKQYSQHFRKYSSNSARYSKFCRKRSKRSENAQLRRQH
jgi:hypothetical protein